MKIHHAIAVGAGLLVSIPALSDTRLRPAFHPTAATAPTTTTTIPLVEFRVAMRTLWEDHITYTRNFIISTLAALPDQEAITERLLANQKNIGDVLVPYYGAAAGQKLTNLLREHILIAAEVVKAAKSEDKASLSKAQQRWSANGKDIATFLSSANPHWPQATLETMLQKHLAYTSGEVVGRLQRDWVADIRSYDLGHMHMLMFADTLTEGIAKQFPDRFKR